MDDGMLAHSAEFAIYTLIEVDPCGRQIVNFKSSTSIYLISVVQSRWLPAEYHITSISNITHISRSLHHTSRS